ncbi:MAG: PD-(D/E)XK nuclease family protein [Muribaculaceae bacterium]
MNQLLAKVREITKTETSFNILDASFGRLENTHSDILAKLLEPRWELVNSLLEMVELDAVSSSSQVFREKHRIDILIKDGKRAIIIENKLGAGDQPQQLAGYYERLSKDGYIVDVIYLTPYGHSPSDDSKGDIKDVKILSYEMHILPWLENAKSKDIHLQNAVKLYAEQVRNTINRNKYMDEIFETCFADEKSAQATVNIIKAIKGKNILSSIKIKENAKKLISSSLEKFYDINIDTDTAKNWIEIYFDDNDCDFEFSICFDGNCIYPKYKKNRLKKFEVNCCDIDNGIVQALLINDQATIDDWVKSIMQQIP